MKFSSVQVVSGMVSGLTFDGRSISPTSVVRHFISRRQDSLWFTCPARCAGSMHPLLESRAPPCAQHDQKLLTANAMFVGNQSEFSPSFVSADVAHTCVSASLCHSCMLLRARASCESGCFLRVRIVLGRGAEYYWSSSLLCFHSEFPRCSSRVCFGGKRKRSR